MLSNIYGDVKFGILNLNV